MAASNHEFHLVATGTGGSFTSAAGKKIIQKFYKAALSSRLFIKS